MVTYKVNISGLLLILLESDIWKGELSFVYLRDKQGGLSFESTDFVMGRIENSAAGYKVNYHITDHLSSVRAIATSTGGGTAPTITSRMDYHPFGTPHMSSPLPTADPKHRYTFCGKEEQRIASNVPAQFKVAVMDQGARYYIPSAMQFTSHDPLAIKYPHISPYTYCAANPIPYVDINGDSVTAPQKEAKQIILNTLRVEDREYVQFGSDGMIDISLLSSHKSNSSNFNKLLELAYSTIKVNISVTNTDISYVDNSGKTQSLEMPYFGPDSYFADPNFTSPNGITTGESGRCGITLLLGKGISGINSPNSNINVIINGGLSPVGAAEVYSHEANGLALMFIRTNDRAKSGHFFQGMKDTNMPLIKMILKSMQETVKNISQ